MARPAPHGNWWVSSTLPYPVPVRTPLGIPLLISTDEENLWLLADKDGVDSLKILTYVAGSTDCLETIGVEAILYYHLYPEIAPRTIIRCAVLSDVEYERAESWFLKYGGITPGLKYEVKVNGRDCYVRSVIVCYKN